MSKDYGNRQTCFGGTHVEITDNPVFALRGV